MFKRTLGGLAATMLLASGIAMANESVFPSSVSEAPAFSFRPDASTPQGSSRTLVRSPSSPSEAPAFTFSAEAPAAETEGRGATGAVMTPRSVSETGPRYRPMK